MTDRPRRQYAAPSAVKRALGAALEAVRAEGLELDVGGISFSADGGVMVVLKKPTAANVRGDGWDDFE